MRTLIYGFKPYKDHQTNISEQVIRRLRKRRGVLKKVFPVVFRKGEFLGPIKKHKPSIILGLGQCPGGKKIRLERKALNKKRDEKGKATRIQKGGAKKLFVNLKLKKDKHSWISYDAGTYVCNFSMYTILDFIKNSKTQFAFLHIPKGYGVKEATKYVEKRIKEMMERV